jgi:uncharacterized protein
MKKLFFGLLLTFSCFCLGATYPSYNGYINDKVNIFSPEEAQMLNNLGMDLEKKTGAEFAVLVVDTLGEETIEEYSNKIFQAWGIGKKGENNGLLLLLAVNDKKVRLEVGYGLEGIINDGKAGEILDKTILPFFKQGQIKEGLINGYLVTSKVLADYYKIELSTNLTPPTMYPDQTENIKLSPVHFVIMAIIFLFLVGTKTGRSMLPWILLMMLSSSRNSGRGFGDFGGSGGFGGFGGGLSGGGGASRGW